ncbi:stAR-related lipid transfer protein 7, mitochondrial [Chironomus tepperi]|uniref:stAR-related lipid transfer protein 7, mitochondrial n=1 Tax=Chironomus tepperi TaxID=113505 RepID=UPI00391F6A0E
MSFSRLSQIFKWRSNYQSNKMKVILKNQLLFYFWTSRLQQSQKIYNFYMKKWHERNFINLIKQLKSNLVHRRQLYSLMAVPLLYSVEDWEQKRIYLDDEAKKYFNDFDHIERLKDPKLFENISTECYYKNGDHPDDDVWEFYVQKDNMITWRKEQDVGQYAYKVYVKYDDITAEDFLHVQMDIDYRREWDHTAVTLEVIDTDPYDDQQVIYWEMLWPKLFSNRDYVFMRKCFIDRKNNVILICCKSVDHPKWPVNPHLQRVNDYWSYMVIKPTTTFNQKGFEFSLTYYDNPGIRIPKYITNYVSQRQLPEFIKQLYNATVKYAEKKLHKTMKDPGYEYPSDTRLDDFDSEEEQMEDNVNQVKPCVRNVDEKESEEENVVEINNRKSWWNYLIPFSYMQ